jgi:hypothetical protein
VLGTSLERSRGLAAFAPRAVPDPVAFGAGAALGSAAEYRRGRARLRRTVELGRDSFAWREVAATPRVVPQPLPTSYAAGAVISRGGLVDRYA